MEAMRHRLEYALVWAIVRSLGALPRPVARAAGMALALLVYLLHGRLRRVGMRNLQIAFLKCHAANVAASFVACFGI